MKYRILLAGVVALGAWLPGAAGAQSGVEIRYPDGTVVQPLPVVPAITPSGDVEVTGAVTTPVPIERRAPEVARPAADPPGCQVQRYAVGAAGVRVHRC